MTRDILDANQNIIGQLTLPDDTSEEVWQEKLAEFAYSPSSPSVDDMITDRVKKSIEWGTQLIISIAVENIQMGISQAGKTKEVVDYVYQVQIYLSNGSLYAAIDQINSLIQAGVPDELSPFVTVDRMNQTLDKINAFLATL